MNNPLLTEAIGVCFLDMDYLIDEHVVFNKDSATDTNQIANLEAKILELQGFLSDVTTKKMRYQSYKMARLEMYIS